MKRPRWVTRVAAIAILMGILGFFGAWHHIQTSYQVLKVKSMLAKYSNEVSLSSPDPATQERLRRYQDGMQKTYQKITDMYPESEGLHIWFAVSGVLGFFISGFYVIAGFFLSMKRSSLAMFYLALGLSISYALFRGLVVYFSSSFFAFGLWLYPAFGMVVNIILFMVVAHGNKQAFQG